MKAGFVPQTANRRAALSVCSPAEKPCGKFGNVQGEFGGIPSLPPVCPDFLIVPDPGRIRAAPVKAILLQFLGNNDKIQFGFHNNDKIQFGFHARKPARQWRSWLQFGGRSFRHQRKYRELNHSVTL
jgi:hypothetical protein